MNDKIKRMLDGTMGSFAIFLAEAFVRADSKNRLVLENAFPEYFK